MLLKRQKGRFCLKLSASQEKVLCQKIYYLLPDTDGSLPKPLTNGQLQKEEGEALGEQHDPVGDQESA